MAVLGWTLGATVLISLLSFVGVFSLALKEERLQRVIFCLVSFATGALIGSSFIHLIPEALSKHKNATSYIIFGIVIFFILEKFLYWRHCHRERCEVHPVSYLSLTGDSIHNFVDGMIIAAGFLTNISLGLSVSLAVAFHEIPQELGDFGILVYGGLSKSKALFYNFFSALTCVFGGLFTYLFAGSSESLTTFLPPFAAGGFLYIALVDLVPALRERATLRESLYQLLLILSGIMLMWAVKALLG